MKRERVSANFWMPFVGLAITFAGFFWRGGVVLGQIQTTLDSHQKMLDSRLKLTDDITELKSEVSFIKGFLLKRFQLEAPRDRE